MPSLLSRTLDKDVRQLHHSSTAASLRCLGLGLLMAWSAAGALAAGKTLSVTEEVGSVLK